MSTIILITVIIAIMIIDFILIMVIIIMIINIIITISVDTLRYDLGQYLVSSIVARPQDTNQAKFVSSAVACSQYLQCLPA
eukprot:6586608-Pyramimonas_sp.AAC.2